MPGRYAFLKSSGASSPNRKGGRSRPLLAWRLSTTRGGEIKHRPVLAALLAPAALALVGSQAAFADPGQGSGNLVFVQSNQAGGNQILVFHRAGDGQLTPAGTYATGGLGGAALPGTQSDHLA